MTDSSKGAVGKCLNIKVFLLVIPQLLIILSSINTVSFMVNLHTLFILSFFLSTDMPDLPTATLNTA